jgi:hypothetical protein
MNVNKAEARNTLFGKNMEVTVYPSTHQHKGKLSILTHPDDVKKVKTILYGTTHSSKEDDALNKT